MHGIYTKLQQHVKKKHDNIRSVPTLSTQKSKKIRSGFLTWFWLRITFRAHVFELGPVLVGPFTIQSGLAYRNNFKYCNK